MGVRLQSQITQRGIVVVEFAISVLVLLFVMLAAVEIGRAYYSYNTLTKAVQNGARYLASNAIGPEGLVDLTDPTLISETQNMVVTGNLDGSGAAVLPDFNTGDISLSQTTAPSGVVNPYIRVVATYQYTPLLSSIPAPDSSPSFNFTFAAGSTMRALR